MVPNDLAFIAAPMVNQSDLPFRTLVRRHGATLAYTQMLIPDRILNDQTYFEHHLRDLTVDEELGHPVVVQLCGNDVDTIVQAGRKLQGFCDGLDLNLGCPQEAAKSGHYGAYLLGQKDWQLVQDIVSVEKTVDLAQRLEACGVSWVTLHARTVSARRRRQGAADLDQIKRLKQALHIPVISNGNVRDWSNIPANLEYTGADGVMVGETLLGNPSLFANRLPDPVDISLEYLEICRRFPDTAPVAAMQAHIRHIIEFQCGRRPWFHKFRTALSVTKSTEDMEVLLRRKVELWRGRPPRGRDIDTPDDATGPDFSGSEANEDTVNSDR